MDSRAYPSITSVFIEYFECTSIDEFQGEIDETTKNLIGKEKNGFKVKRVLSVAPTQMMGSFVR